VVLALLSAAMGRSPRNDIIYGYWILTKTIFSEQDEALNERTGFEPLLTKSAKSAPP
jgi:hypothetical protein